MCLLDEVNKLFERVIAACLEAHMLVRVPGLHESQYSFWRDRSTVDAVNRVQAVSGVIVSQSEVTLAVSLDIVNAFNTILCDVFL